MFQIWIRQIVFILLSSYYTPWKFQSYAVMIFCCSIELIYLISTRCINAPHNICCPIIKYVYIKFCIWTTTASVWPGRALASIDNLLIILVNTFAQQFSMQTISFHFLLCAGKNQVKDPQSYSELCHCIVPNRH